MPRLVPSKARGDGRYGNVRATAWYQGLLCTAILETPHPLIMQANLAPPRLFVQAGFALGFQPCFARATAGAGGDAVLGRDRRRVQERDQARDGVLAVHALCAKALRVDHQHAVFG